MKRIMLWAGDVIYVGSNTVACVFNGGGGGGTGQDIF